MAMFPLYVNFQLDFVPILLPIDTEASMDELAQASAHHCLDKRVSAPADDYVLRVRLHKSSELYPRDMKVGEAGFRVGETVDIMFTDPNTNEIIGSDNVMECK